MGGGLVPAQDLLNDSVTYANFNLDVAPYATLPAQTSNIISMTTQPGLDRLYVSTQEGVVYAVDSNGDGTGNASAWFDVGQSLQGVTGGGLNFQNFPHGGLRSIAFHPEYDKPGAGGYGKFYASVMHQRPNDPGAHLYLGNSDHGNGVNADGAVFEFTYDFGAQQVDAGSARELFRVNMPVYDHPIKQIKFNQHATPQDDDYGLLYIAHGDASVQSATAGGGQNMDDALGKILRINPLQSGPNSYTVPASNPFVGQSGVLEELYAVGFRNPHTFSFHQDQGTSYLIGADAGRDNIEEVNLVVAGGNYGWSEREGTFVHQSSGGFIAGVTDLPSNEASLHDYIYPAAQVDHNTGAVTANPGDGFVGFAIVGGHVINSPVDPNLDNLYFYSNFGASGDMFFTHFDEMQDAVIDLEPGDPTRDHPSELAWAESHLIRLAFDHDNNSATSPILYDNFNELLGDSRSDTRLGEGVYGEMYISSKRNGAIYLAPGTMPNDLLTLMVDRATGAATIVSGTGVAVEVDGVVVQSTSGALIPGEFQLIGPEWAASAENNSSKLVQLSENSSLVIDGQTPASLGKVVQPTVTEFGVPPGESVGFQYTGPGGSSVGRVIFTGESNVPYTIILTVDLVTGEASMQNQTAFSQEVEGYTISSLSGSLDPANWDSLEEQQVDDGDWAADSQLASRLVELQENGTTTFESATPYALGAIFQPSGTQDLLLQFLIAGESVPMQGVTQYILAGDYNNDGVVDAADYTVWRDHLGAETRLPNDMTPGLVTLDDYHVWNSHYGASLVDLAIVATAPEPSACLLAAVMGLCAVARAGAGARSPGRPPHRNTKNKNEQVAL